MADHHQTQILHEISLAISPGETLQATAETALGAYLQKLNCAVGGVLRRRDDGGYDQVVARPTAAADDPVYAAARHRLAERAAADDPHDPLPIVGEIEAGHFYLFELGEFGVLVLGTRGTPFSEAIIEALEPLNEKLATACTAKAAESTLRDERRRFEALFTTIQEPMATVSVRDGTATITRTNNAFESTFGDATSMSDGSRFEPTIPTAAADAETTAEIDAQLADSQPVTEAVSRHTATDTGVFLLRAGPVTTAAGEEYFLLYVDITDEKRRRRTLESLYEDAQAVLTSEDRQTACEQTVETATTIIDATVAEVQLYDRATDALTPAATTAAEPVVAAAGEDDETPLWAVYGGDVRWIDSLSAADESIAHSGSVESVLAYPLGDHGVLILGDEQSGAFNETDRQLGQLLTTLGTIALTRAQRIQSLEAVQAITQEAVTAETRSAMVDAVLDELPTALNFPIAGLWEHNMVTDRLEPLGVTEPAFDLLSSPPTFGRGDGIAWEAFERGQTELVADVANRPAAYNEDSVIRSEVIAPIDEFGLLIAGAVRPQNLTDTDRSIVETLTSNLATAIQLVDNREELNLLEAVFDRVLRHNLRNDLTVIKGYANAVAEECEAAPHTAEIIDRCENLERTATNARKMREVVQTRGKRQTIDITTAIDDAIELTPDPPAAVSITTEIDTQTAVVAHPKLPVAIAQLIENSLEHGVDSGEVRVTAVDDDDSVIVEVSDNGPGIPSAELAVIGHHDESELEHGSGVGLWLIDRIVDYSDGVLSFDTDGGTTARITLPAA
jgi:signal transduction histidine kinase